MTDIVLHLLYMNTSLNITHLTMRRIITATHLVSIRTSDAALASVRIAVRFRRDLCYSS